MDPEQFNEISNTDADLDVDDESDSEDEDVHGVSLQFKPSGPVPIKEEASIIPLWNGNVQSFNAYGSKFVENKDDHKLQEAIVNLKQKRKSWMLNGIGDTLKILKSEGKKTRITIDSQGHTCAEGPSGVTRIAKVWPQPSFAPIIDMQLDYTDLPPPPPHPTDPAKIRKLVRSKMIRCKRCKNRFGERNLYERHLRDRHPPDYETYIKEQEEEMEQQRLDELEANRIEELQSGGFIPPANDLESYTADITDGAANGSVDGSSLFGVMNKRRVYKKKVSPQCPFCDKRYRNECSLKKHIIKKHPEDMEFIQCLRCFKCLRDKQALKEHICEMSYICFQCTPLRNMCTASRLIHHRKKFHRGANSGFKCHQCNMKFLTPRKLRKHKKMSHVFTKTYQCHFCEELFISEVAVMTHERIHTGMIRFECKICDFRCNRFITMEEHMKEEHGFICAICQNNFVEWAELKQHTLSEHGGYLTNESSSGYIESPRVYVMFKGE